MYLFHRRKTTANLRQTLIIAAIEDIHGDELGNNKKNMEFRPVLSAIIEPKLLPGRIPLAIEYLLDVA
ncbi:MAG: hypothetical protein OQK04_17340 [Kangiellaceae bacterium]|nr:hypothetical protein [Kangiellaceae bacterium]